MSKGMTGIQKVHLEASEQICVPGTESSYRRIVNLVLSIPFPQSSAFTQKVLSKYLLEKIE